jgi:hydroxyacylglutathione hydrolase
MFQRFYDEGLAQAACLVGCDRTKQAVVIDPRRDASVHVAAARQLGATIVAAIETHVHADFVSGARELAAAGARVYAGPGADLEYDHHVVHDCSRTTSSNRCSASWRSTPRVSSRTKASRAR